MTRVYIFISLIFLFSCKSINKSILLKDTEILDTPFAFADPKKNFPWIVNILGEKDSIFISKKSSKKINVIFNFYKEGLFKKDEIFFPKYAFIDKSNKVPDTIYFNRDFTEAYLSKRKIVVKDTSRIMEKFLNRKYKKFLKRDYLYYYNKFNLDE